ncbi:tRNA (guanine(46)-N(7))-methyltransferase TrmB [Arthrobacter pigmenti]
MNSKNDDGTDFRRLPVSFVRRSARLSTGQQRAWDNYSGQFLIDIPRGQADTSVDPGFVLDPADVFGRVAPLVVEVGSGAGEAVIHAAEQHPEINYLAIEVYTPGLAQTLMQIGRRELENVRLIQANAPEVLTTALPPGSVDELWVFFPDPWHKNRHHKRRLVSPGFAGLAARVLKPGGRWRLATDWARYARVMRGVGDTCEYFTNIHADDSSTTGKKGEGWAPRFDGRVMTGFEKKALGAGRTVHDLTYKRIPGTGA